MKKITTSLVGTILLCLCLMGRQALTAPIITTRCGDGIAQGTEQCDGKDFKGTTCTSLGFSNGNLICQKDCSISRSRCLTDKCQDPKIKATIDDKNACTQDTCDKNTGVVKHTAISVDDGKACTVDKCDPNTGKVTHTEACPAGNTCNANGVCVNKKDVVSVSLGSSSACAVRKDGTVWCWGWNNDGQLGDGTNVNRPFPVQVKGLSDVVMVAAGDDDTCAVLQNGTAWCWGQNNFGQLGDGTTTESLVPVRVLGLDH